jgi:hypothetical protein
LQMLFFNAAWMAGRSLRRMKCPFSAHVAVVKFLTNQPAADASVTFSDIQGR